MKKIQIALGVTIAVLGTAAWLTANRVWGNGQEENGRQAAAYGNQDTYVLPETGSGQAATHKIGRAHV